jgi:alcohol dehydrogenase
VRGLTEGRGADYSFEATGITKVMEQAFLATRKGGVTVILGVTSPEDRLVLPSWTIVGEERVVTGAYMGSVVPRRDIPMLLELYASGRIKLDEIITDTIKLEEINEGLERLASGEAIRQIVKTW